MSVKAFFLEPTDQERLWLRRYSINARPNCGDQNNYHNAMLLLGEEPIQWVEHERGRIIADRSDRMPPPEDPRWPRKCERCAYEFAPDDQYQLFGRTLYRRQDTGDITTIEDAPDGAMWNAYWMTPRLGGDGMFLMAKVPGGCHWALDSRASNCDMPNDNEHRCWIRHGTPPLITVDKNGHTCGAGGGSIQTANWHGFLRNGEFV